MPSNTNIMRIFTELKNYVQHQFAHPSGTVEIPFITYSLKPMQQFVTIRISTGVVYGVNNTPYIINTIFKPTVRTHQLRELFFIKAGESPILRVFYGTKDIELRPNALGTFTSLFAVVYKTCPNPNMFALVLKSRNYIFHFLGTPGIKPVLFRKRNAYELEPIG